MASTKRSNDGNLDPAGSYKRTQTSYDACHKVVKVADFVFLIADAVLLDHSTNTKPKVIAQSQAELATYSRVSRIWYNIFMPKLYATPRVTSAKFSKFRLAIYSHERSKLDRDKPPRSYIKELDITGVTLPEIQDQAFTWRPAYQPDYIETTTAKNYLFLKQLPLDLQGLRTSRLTSGTIQLCELSRFTNLRFLELSGLWSGIRLYEMLQATTNLDSLESLVLPELDYDAVMKSTTLNERFPSWPKNLEHLSLWQWFKDLPVSFEATEQLVEAWPNSFRKLSLRDCSNLEGIIAFVRSLSFHEVLCVKYLHLSGEIHRSKLPLQKIFELFPSLATLEVPMELAAARIKLNPNEELMFGDYLHLIRSNNHLENLVLSEAKSNYHSGGVGPSLVIETLKYYTTKFPKLQRIDISEHHVSDRQSFKEIVTTLEGRAPVAEAEKSGIFVVGHGKYDDSKYVISAEEAKKRNWAAISKGIDEGFKGGRRPRRVRGG